jgi:phosphate transport system substrate-binding protein
MKTGSVAVAGLAWMLAGAARPAAQPAAADPALPGYRPGAAVSGRLVGRTGMDTVEAMMAAWNEAFRRFHPGAEIAIEMHDGLAPEERIALGPGTAELFHPTYRQYEDTYGYEPFRVKFCLGAFVLKSHVSAIGVYVNRHNPLPELTLAQLDAVFSPERRRGYPTDITTWGQLGLGGEWADRPIHLYGFYWRDDVTAYFRRLVMFDAPFKSTYVVPGGALSRRTPVVAAAIMAAMASDPDGIAFGNASYATDRVRALALADRHGGVGRFTAGDVAGGRYPLDRYLYFYVNRPPGRPLAPLVREFLTFVLSREGQELVTRDHYLPLPAAVAAAERNKLN